MAGCKIYKDKPTALWRSAKRKEGGSGDDEHEQLELCWNQSIFDRQNWGEKEKQKLGNILKLRFGTLQGQFLDMKKISRGADRKKQDFVVLVR